LTSGRFTGLPVPATDAVVHVQDIWLAWTLLKELTGTEFNLQVNPFNIEQLTISYTTSDSDPFAIYERADSKYKVDIISGGIQISLFKGETWSRWLNFREGRGQQVVRNLFSFAPNGGTPPIRARREGQFPLKITLYNRKARFDWVASEFRDEFNIALDLLLELSTCSGFSAGLPPPPPAPILPLMAQNEAQFQD
jgi:hypothetical protein